MIFLALLLVYLYIHYSFSIEILAFTKTFSINKLNLDWDVTYKLSQVIRIMLCHQLQKYQQDPVHCYRDN